MTLIFSHVPKTAGTSLRTSLSTQFSRRKILLDYGPHSEVTSDSVKKFVYEEKDYFAFGMYLKRQRIKLVAGHFDSYKYAPLVGAENIISIIREPSARIISEFNHLKRMGRYEYDLSDFINQDSCRNKQVKWLGNIKLPLLGIVGLTERYSNSIELINKLYGLKLKGLRLNSGDQDKNQLFRNQCGDAIKQLNNLDFIFYSKVESWLENIDMQVTRTKNLVRGWVDFDSNADSFVGACWLDTNLNSEKNSRKAVDIEIYVDDRHLTTIRADSYNKYVAQYSPIRGGYVGFSIRSDMVRDFEKLCFCNSINKAHLFGSPFYRRKEDI